MFRFEWLFQREAGAELTTPGRPEDLRLEKT